MTAKTGRGQRYLVACALVKDDNVEAIFPFLKSLPAKDELFELFGLILSRINRIKATPHFVSLVEFLQQQLWDLRELQKKVATDGEMDRLQSLIDQEIHVAFGLALLSYLDQQSTLKYQQIALDLFTGGLADPKEWLDHPALLVRRFTQERLYWVTSLLLCFSHHRFLEADVAIDFKKRAIPLIENFKKIFAGSLSKLTLPPEYSERSDASPREIENNIKTNCDQLLKYLGRHQTTARHEVIGFLHSSLIYIPEWHSSVARTMRRALDELVRIAARGREAVFELAPVGHPERRRQQMILEDAMFASGVLERIAAAAANLYRFSPAAAADCAYYSLPSNITEQGHRRSLLADVKFLGDLLLNIREQNRFAQDALDDFTRVWDAVEGHLYRVPPESFLRKTLLRYIQSLEDTLATALEEACVTMERKQAVALRDPKNQGKRPEDIDPHANVWTEQKREWERRANDVAAQRRYVLADRLEITELLKNIFTNAQHAFGSWPEGRAIPRDAVNLQVEAEPGGTHWTIRINYRFGEFGEKYLPGRISSSESLDRHKLDVEQYGGSLNWGNAPPSDGTGTFTELKLLRRQDPHRETVRTKL